MTRDIYEAADDLDEERDRAYAMRCMAHEARRHGYRARVTLAGNVLVVGDDGSVLATRSARRLAEWMGY